MLNWINNKSYKIQIIIDLFQLYISKAFLIFADCLDIYELQRFIFWL